MEFTTPVYVGVNLDANDGPQMNAVAIIFIILSFTTLVLRLFSRLHTKVSIGMDDELIVVAAVLSWGYTATVIFEVEHNYYGQHIGKSDTHHLEEFNKGLYGLAIVYPLALTFSKLSLLALYWRIFRVTNARRPLQIVAALNIGWMIAAFIVGIFSCTPIRGFWDATIKSRCIQYPQFFTSNESFTIILDLVVLLMPVYFISHLQRSVSQRISISSTFLLGLVVTVVSAVRLWQLVLAQRKPGFDPTFNETPAALWAIVELNLWIIVASIPALRPLITKTLQDRRERNSASGSKSYTYGSGSLKGLKALLWPSQGRPSTLSRSNGRLPLDGEETRGAVGAESSRSVEDYNVQVSAPVPREATWTPLGVAEVGLDDVQLQELGGIRVDREVKVSQPENAYHRI
ncbi:hypothetical protein HO173_007776 [Letharia columbiana]|uniref:Rhodopsin domain-containing protein n=1 Tax=Letharia columbiana TaxID=112416 RepID=A0A8H6FSI0_9LECA|nr:uncharacterized protein HO173_007776 [Letharia columbiana]KAF6233946.1 hypothetical protein HO173_007776 [Letharia columbiana]